MKAVKNENGICEVYTDDGRHMLTVRYDALKERVIVQEHQHTWKIVNAGVKAIEDIHFTVCCFEDEDAVYINAATVCVELN